jgi:hypothetical protein
LLQRYEEVMPMLTEFTRLGLGFTVTFGPLVGVLLLLNLRDRRVATLRHVVLAALPLHELRGLIAVQARCAMFSRKSVVTLDMFACTRDQIWDAVTRLYHNLPRHVRLVVNSAVDQQFTTTLTLETGGRRPLYRPRQASIATG